MLKIKNLFTLALAATLLVGITSACTVKDDDRPADEDPECDAAVPLIDAGMPDATNVDAPPTPTKCTVTVRATDPSANEDGDTATVQFERSGCSLVQLEVKFDLSGSASPDDYVGWGGWYVSFSAGATTATRIVTPFNDTIVEGPETLVFIIRPEPHIIVGAPNTATVTILDNDVANQAPVANDDSTSTVQNQAVVISTATLLSNDTDPNGNTLTVSGVSGATNGTVSLSGNNVTFTPATGFVGTAGFNYTVSDGTLTATAHVTVTVNGQVCTPSLTLSAVPDHINSGQTSNLRWTTTCVNTDGCRITGGQFGSAGEIQQPNSNVNATPPISTTYTMTCTAQGGQTLIDTTDVIVNNLPVGFRCDGSEMVLDSSQLTFMSTMSQWVLGWGLTPGQLVRSYMPSATNLGGLDVCAQTAPKGDGSGSNHVPQKCRGIYHPNNANVVLKWESTGCPNLPGHPDADPQAGCAFDGNCKLGSGGQRQITCLSWPSAPCWPGEVSATQ